MKQLAKTFDKKAVEYHRYRPGYPTLISEDIINVVGLFQGCRILEIGCGAGQATGLFIDLKPIQVCIDPGTKLLEQCKAVFGNVEGYSFVCSSFEDYEGSQSSFDLIYAATCFHWLLPGLRFRKPATLLNAQGALAVFTDQHTKGKEGFFIEAQEVYNRLAPELTNIQPSYAKNGSIDEDNPLVLVHEAEYDRDIVYTSDEYIGLLKTFSDHIALGEKRLNELCDGVHTLINTRYNGKIIKTLTTCLSIYMNAQQS